MIKRFLHLGMLAAVMSFSENVPAQNTVAIQANEPSANISSNLFGIFFEEINMAGDGGIYAELIRNRSFEDASTPVWWTFVTNATAAGGFAIDSSYPLSTNNLHCLKLTKTGGLGAVGAVNNGYYGIPLANGATYNLGFYARVDSGFNDGNSDASIVVSLESTNGTTIYAQTSVGGLTTNWQHFSLSLVPNTTDPFAQLALQISQNSSAYIDFVSLFPAVTFNDRTNGLRPDLAAQLVNLKPSFMRFPGGSWVDGTSLRDAYHWEPTIGDPANRTERANVWGYMVSNGLGYHEYLQMCEDIGAQPLFCINCGMDVSQNAVPTNQLGPWVQEVLDAIEYANGDTNTYWGAQRAANGHPAPFNLQYVEIGNENNGSAYNANYSIFYDTIKSNYPSIHLIADSFGTIPTSAPVEMVDEHYYNSASWFAQNSTHYDSYSRTGPKVFVGEYAVAYDIGPGFAATLQNALGEAAWMTGMERNSDIVSMAAYAPLFANWNNQDWSPDLIYFNGTNVYGTPSYYVQQMFSLNRGNLVLPTTVTSSTGNLYVSSSLIQSSGQIIVKAVNFNNSSLTTTFNLAGVTTISPNAMVIQLTGSASATNSFTTPATIFPVTNSINNAGTSFSVTLPANSLSIFRLQGNGFNSPTNLQLQIDSNLNVGQEAASSVTAQISGQTINLTTNYAVTYSSLDTNVAIVTPTGLVIGAGIGTTQIIAAYSGLYATQNVQVAAAVATHLIHRYSFNDGTANDSVGTANGTFYNGSGYASIANGQLNLAGNSGDYVDFGPGIITTTNITTGALTFESWATFYPVNGAWARLFDFGNISGTSGGNYIFLSPANAANGGSARMAVTDTMPGSAGESGITFNNLLGQTNIHIVVVFNPTPANQTLKIYTNGVLMATALTGGNYIASINDVYSFLGHSLWSSDAWLNGSINEFRICDGELDKFQIAASYTSGPNTTNYNPGAVTGLSLSAGTMPIAAGNTAQLSAGLNFNYAASVNVIGDSNLTLSSGDTNIFTVNSSGLITAVGAGTAILTVIYNYTENDANSFYTNSTQITVGLPTYAVLSHRYSFSEANGSTTTADSIGGSAWNGTLPNGGTFSNGQLTLSSASDQYVQLPSGILGSDTAVTIESWVTFPDQLPVNCFFYGFGNTDSSGSGEDYIFCAPQGGRIAITSVDPGYTGEQNASGTGDLSYQTNLHFVAVYDPPAGYLALYTNGVLAAINTGVTVPMSAVNDVLNYIGRSLYNTDPYPDLTLDEFRIYSGALSANQIAATQLLGSNQLLSQSSPVISVSLSGNNLILTWPLTAAGFTLTTQTNLVSGGWTPVNSPAPQIVGNQWQVMVPVSNSTQFFQLEE